MGLGINRLGADFAKSINKQNLGMHKALFDLPTFVPQFAKDGGMIKSYEEGGQVVGPGTGTSDSIPAQVPAHNFIIPAEVVQKYGKEFFDRLLELAPEAGGEKMAVMLSNGEYNIPASLVDLLGQDFFEKLISEEGGEMEGMENMPHLAHGGSPIDKKIPHMARGGLLEDEDDNSGFNRIPENVDKEILERRRVTPDQVRDAPKISLSGIYNEKDRAALTNAGSNFKNAVTGATIEPAKKAADYVKSYGGLPLGVKIGKGASDLADVTENTLAGVGNAVTAANEGYAKILGHGKYSPPEQIGREAIAPSIPANQRSIVNTPRAASGLNQRSNENQTQDVVNKKPQEQVLGLNRTTGANGVTTNPVYGVNDKTPSDPNIYGPGGINHGSNPDQAQVNQILGLNNPGQDFLSQRQALIDQNSRAQHQALLEQQAFAPYGDTTRLPALQPAQSANVDPSLYEGQRLAQQAENQAGQLGLQRDTLKQQSKQFEQTLNKPAPPKFIKISDADGNETVVNANEYTQEQKNINKAQQLLDYYKANPSEDIPPEYIGLMQKYMQLLKK